MVLNACYSEQQAKAIAEHIDYVIGMSNAISDSAAISFSAAFYQALGYGIDFRTAFELGCAQIDLENLGEQDTPKFLTTKSNLITEPIAVDQIERQSTSIAASKPASSKKKVDRKNQKMGNPYLKWAFSAIIVNGQSFEPIKKYMQKLESRHGRAKARARIAHKFCKAVYYMLKNEQPFDDVKFLQNA